MAGHTLRIELDFGMRSLRCLMAAGMICSAVSELASENVTLTTYYPAPSGVYAQMITTHDTRLARDGGDVIIGSPSTRTTLNVNGDAHISGTVATENATINNDGSANFNSNVTVKGTVSTVGFISTGLARMDKGVQLGDDTQCNATLEGKIVWHPNPKNLLSVLGVKSGGTLSICSEGSWLPIYPPPPPSPEPKPEPIYSGSCNVQGKIGVANGNAWTTANSVAPAIDCQYCRTCGNGSSWNYDWNCERGWTRVVGPLSGDGMSVSSICSKP